MIIYSQDFQKGGYMNVQCSCMYVCMYVCMSTQDQGGLGACSPRIFVEIRHIKKFTA